MNKTNVVLPVWWMHSSIHDSSHTFPMTSMIWLLILLPPESCWSKSQAHDYGWSFWSNHNYGLDLFSCPGWCDMIREEVGWGSECNLLPLGCWSLPLACQNRWLARRFIALPLGCIKSGPTGPGILGKIELTLETTQGREGDWQADKLERSGHSSRCVQIRLGQKGSNRWSSCQKANKTQGWQNV